MNDRFKFRCYNKFQEKMFDVINITWFYEEIKRIEAFEPETKKIFIFDEYDQNIKNTILMQCSGLKDINGKLIYEGDIVKVFHVSSTEQCRLDKRYVVYDEDKARYIMCENGFMSYITVNLDDVYEVIGNIYENAELLKECEVEDE